LSAIQVGDLAPDFTLPAHGGGEVRLHDLLGRKTIVLYFYPRDHTPGCTAEARAFRDSYETFVAAGAEVVGVSSDSLASHERFAAKHHLPFILLSDVQGEVRKRYGVEKTLGIIPGRVTYVIDRTGIVRHVFASQFQAERHVQEAMRALDALEPLAVPGSSA
jgi:thioredoxin-dependent peroxiredoxin